MSYSTNQKSSRSVFEQGQGLRRGICRLDRRNLRFLQIATGCLIGRIQFELADLAARLPACASADYGTPFYDIYKRYDSDFYRIDPMLFSPAEVWLTSATTGRTFHGGHLNPDVLGASLLAEN